MSDPLAPPPVTGPPAAASGAAGVFTLIIGLLIGLGLGLGVGYPTFHKAAATAPGSGGPKPTFAVPTFSFPAFSTDTPSASPSASAGASTGQIVPCPPTVPSGQHDLGTVGTGPSGATADPSLHFCGQGSVTVPDTGTFTTGDSWGIGYTHSCPTGTAPGGMGTAVTISEQNQDGSPGPDSPAQGSGDWGSQESDLFATGRTYQLHVDTLSPDCVWELQVYTT